MDNYCCLFEHNERFYGRCGNYFSNYIYGDNIMKKYNRKIVKGEKKFRESTELKKAEGARHDRICQFHYDFITKNKRVNKTPKEWTEKAKDEIHNILGSIMSRALQESCHHNVLDDTCPFCMISFAFKSRKRKAFASLVDDGRTKKERIKMAKATASAWLGTPTEIGGKILVEMKVALSMLMSRNGMSDRLYVRHRAELETNGVILPSLAKVKEFKNCLLIPRTWKCTMSGCLCCITSVQESIVMVLENEDLRQRMVFKTPDEQESIFMELKKEAPLLYGNLQQESKTVWIRFSPDNHRTAGNQNAERVSFMILNFENDIDNPFYEIFACLWRGKETRQEFQRHCGQSDGYPYVKNTTCSQEGVFNILADLVVNGITVREEYFNVVVVLVPDLCCLETLLGISNYIFCSNVLKLIVLGRQTGTSENGDSWCTKTLQEKKNPNHFEISPLRSLKTIVENGMEAETIYKNHEMTLGGAMVNENRQPIKGIPKKCSGQKRSTMISCVCIWTMPPDVLHLGLALHRIGFQVLMGFVIETDTQNILHDAFVTMGATTLAHSFKEEVAKRKGVISKDIMPTLNGNSCAILEYRIGFLFTQLFENFENTVEERKRSKNIIMMYKYFGMLSVELKKKKCTMNDYEYLSLLIPRVIKSVADVLPLGKYNNSVYLHVLKDDVLRFQKFWILHCGWGIGMFWTSPAEHANKFVKEAELRATNLSMERFMRVVQDQFIRLLHFPEHFDVIGRKLIRCGSCGGPGHMKTKKSCPNYTHRFSFNPGLYFDMLTLTEEDMKVLSFNPWTRVYDDNPVVDDVDEDA